ncbi:AlpA family transcriptional regulator [Streptomyces sp. LS1784]|uniref:helix-turn-helix transcriptional regulator n=1 Tax=Streptomyces sp. LS1784 TaxID=2851533 RepID=UPI001CCC61B0|nr:hypothetical protein [Streptomyces sp. LS1784]
MPTIARLALRAAPECDHARYEDIDLDQLSPRARALAEAVQQRSLATAGVIWCALGTVRSLIPDAEQWHADDDLGEPVFVPWSAWSAYPDDSEMDPHDYLEQQARRINPAYSIVGAHPRTPVPSYAAGAADDGWTRQQVLDYLRAAGRPIAPGTWSSYVARGQAPAPVRRVGRTPLWNPAEIKAWTS